MVYAMLFFVLLACNNESKTSDSEITYYNTVAPMLDQYCIRCHEGSGPGIGDFTSPESVQQLAPLILDAMQSGRMPPPAADPQCREYVGAEDLFLPPEKSDLFSAWIDADMPLGTLDESTEQENPDVESTDIDGDLEIRLREPYVPQYVGENAKGNEYRCFVLEHDREEDFYITELQALIDRTEIVHHAVLAKGKKEDISEGALGADGVECLSGAAEIIDGNGSSGSGMIVAWAPGAEPHRFDDAGILVQKDEVFVLQLHYYQGGAQSGLSDQSGFLLKTADQVDTTLLMAPYGYYSFNIPANDPSYTYSEELEMPIPIRIWSVFPHMHLLGSGYDLSVLRSQGEEDCIVRSDNYDFNNQLTYQFKDPISIQTGDRLRWGCTWNNDSSNPNLYYDPPQDVQYGARTDQEMCYAFTLISIGAD